MRKLDEWIKELCPDGVAYKKLGGVVSVCRGARVVRAELQPAGKYPVYQNSLTPMGYHDKGNCIAGTAFIIGAGAAGDIGYSDVPFWAADDCFYFVCEENMNARFLYHVLSGQETFIRGKVRKASVPRLPRNAIENMIVPLPPPDIQREIVRTLDNFTELTARKQQYEHYRNSLLSFEDEQSGDNIPQVELRSVVKKHCTGATPKKGNAAYYESGNIPWIRTQDVKFNEIYKVDSFITEEAVKRTAVKWIPENCVIVAISGASAGRCAVNKIRATTNQHCLNMEIDEEKALYQYVYYCVSAHYDELVAKKQGARGDLNSTLILETKIPMPPIKTQKQIVDKIDAFNALLNDLASGLPAEIAARQQQYEYYRDKLLTFTEK